MGTEPERRSEHVELRACAFGWPEGCKYHLPDEWIEWCVPCLQRDGKAICTCTCPKPDGDDPECLFHGRPDAPGLLTAGHEHRWGEPKPVADGPSTWFRICLEPDCDAWIASDSPGPPTHPDVSGAVKFGGPT